MGVKLHYGGICGLKGEHFVRDFTYGLVWLSIRMCR